MTLTVNRHLPVLDVHGEGELSERILAHTEEIFAGLQGLEGHYLVDTINKIRTQLVQYSPFRDEPVDCVQWVEAELVGANDYNPNSVAPPEMKLLEHSIMEDGFTQPIVSWEKPDAYEVVDGFHRNRVGKESEKVRKRTMGYLPLVVINDGRLDRGDRMAATIRHNRARGKHRVDHMSEIVLELKRRNWTDEKIGRELGMDPDEILRLCQISGLAEAFRDHVFSEAWEAAIDADDDLDTKREDIDAENEAGLPACG